MSTECPARWLIYESKGDHEPRAGSEAMVAALNVAGCNVTETIVPGFGHGYHLFRSAEAALLVALGG